MSNRPVYIAPIMCGRYTAAKDFAELVKLVGLIIRVPFFAPRYNIAPTQLAPVIFLENAKPAIKLMRWGLIPSWARDETTGNALINARVETLKTRQAFRQAYQKRRCLNYQLSSPRHWPSFCAPMFQDKKSTKKSTVLLFVRRY
jgi:hypothetical protein